MSFKKRIKTNADIKEKHSEIMTLIDQGSVRKAEEVFEEISLFEPYSPEILYHLAKGFASFDKEKALDYLISAHDIDSAYLDKATNEKAIAGFIDETQFAEVLSGELSRKWNVIDFDQIEPELMQGTIRLYFNKRKRDEVMEILYSLDDRVENFFGWEHKWKKDGRDEPEDHFILQSNSDRIYVHYSQLFLAFKKLSLYCEDIRFTMSSEPVSFVDEIIIEKGIFYSIRHIADGPYWDDKLEVMERLADQYPTDISLRKFVSNEYVHWASFGINRRGKEYEVSTKNEQVETIEKYLNKSFHYNPNNPEAYFQRGRWFHKMGRRKEAKTDYKRVIKLDNNHFEAHYELSKLEYKNNHFKQALEYINRAWEIKPEYNDLYFRRGLIYLKINDVEHAEEDFKTCIKKVNFHNASALLRYAYKLIKNNYHQQAESFYQGVLEKNKSYMKDLKEREEKSSGSSTDFYKNLRNTIKKQNSDAYIGLSLIEGDNKSAYRKALKHIKQAILLNDESAIAWYNQGHVYQNLGKLDKAEESYNKSIELDNTDCKPLHNKSIIFLQQQNYEEAIKLANKVLQLDPKHIDSLTVKANALFFLKRYKRAIQVYEKVISYFPESDVGYHGAGLCYSWLKDDEKASQYNKKAGEINPQNYYALSNLGNNLSNLGKYNEALKVLDKVIAKKPTYYHSYYVKACVYAQTGKEKQAIEMIKLTLKHDPGQKENLCKEKDFKLIRKSKAFEYVLKETRSTADQTLKTDR